VAQLTPHDAAKAVAHPLRAAILTALADREASPTELAKEMGEPLPNVSYHVRALHKLGALALYGKDRYASRGTRLHRGGKDQSQPRAAVALG
jgi:DNA-binding transcriptional ArsR family regulator